MILCTGVEFIGIYRKRGYIVIDRPSDQHDIVLAARGPIDCTLARIVRFARSPRTWLLERQANRRLNALGPHHFS